MVVDSTSRQARMEWGEAGQWGRVRKEPLKFTQANNLMWHDVGQPQPLAAQAAPKEHSYRPSNGP